MVLFFFLSPVPSIPKKKKKKEKKRKEKKRKREREKINMLSEQNHRGVEFSNWRHKLNGGSPSKEDKSMFTYLQRLQQLLLPHYR